MTNTGWWFQTFFIFHNIRDNISHWLSYVSRWLLHHQTEYFDLRFSYIWVIWLDITRGHTLVFSCLIHSMCCCGIWLSSILCTGQARGQIMYTRLYIYYIQVHSFIIPVKFHKISTYCRWKKSCTSWLMVYSSTIPLFIVLHRNPNS